MQEVIQLKPCLTNGQYTCSLGYTACSACGVWIDYERMEDQVIKQCMEEFMTMSEEKRKYLEDQVRIATGKDKEIE